jgi:hypothetical protein
MVRAAIIAAFAVGLSGAPVTATSQQDINATLGGDPAIWSGLFTLALADQIRTVCPTIEARTIRATRFVYDVYSLARAYGYSRQEIRAFQVDDSTEERMRAEVLAYFQEHNVREGEPETYCALGEAEIAAGTPAGTLLRAR